jgi:CRISPR-associated protein Cmr1
MTKIEATYRIVTPMFCSGADQTRAELRLPSFKGVLRFWWRALSYGRQGSLGSLRTEEDRLFGSTRTGQAQVLLNLLSPVPTAADMADQKHFPQNSPQGYVGYGLTDAKERPSRQFIRPGVEFTVRVAGRSMADDDWASVETALVAAGMFGGMGGRSRKGWGSLTLHALNTNDRAVWAAPRTRDALGQWHKEFLKGMALQSGTPPISAFSSASRVVVGPEHRTAQDAHRWLEDKYRTAVRSAHPEPAREKPEREQFGLPRPKAGKNTAQRRASPVFLHVHQEEGGPAVPVVLFLPAKFLETQQEPAGAWRHVETFLQKVEGS